MDYNLLDPKYDKNTMIQICRKINELTDGLCYVGASPNGFGTVNLHNSEIDLIIDSNIDMVSGEIIFPDEVEGYEVSVVGWNDAANRNMTEDELQGLSEQSYNPHTQLIISALSKFQTQYISTEDCQEAFSALASLELDEAEQKETQSPSMGM